MSPEAEREIGMAWREVRPGAPVRNTSIHRRDTVNWMSIQKSGTAD